ncbi:MAG: hypothetical protein M0D57_04605 [Sphingobacteriales bacterium JAD_PAG50586_3]|nr:MAG: hypothetical protein M0D57_04605 [Sphingobacteriales bacterium JAD_PAG50586_3]
MKKTQGVTLALYPNTRGVAYALLETPRDLIDCGVLSCRPFSTDKLFRRVTSLLLYYKPEIVLLRDYNTRFSQKSNRIYELINRLSLFALAKNIPVYQYSREKVKEVFEVFGARTKHEIAKTVSEAVPALKPRLPKPKQIWQSEHHSMGIFDAAALGITHAYLTE